MDDGFTPLHQSIDTVLFKNCLNSMHPRIRYTIEPARKTVTENENVQTINFLDITIILHENNEIETEIYYKETNSHDYLDFRSHHAKHVIENIPFNLAKRIICFHFKWIKDRKAFRKSKKMVKTM